ncbi:MlaC/ttg2D family ABC transporter substrate-binding protein [Agarilytica rhodophyticola]|uniref:MlaC/ttg2D family ABC transporter substrate-binding protein n=1 Tax=Agarilytica rhodophyticola TaxID=1737490 RepID=UPI000B349E3C|nr:ABC transporter substrate-binding protein [Agarilytica rhodophyticola]
MKFALHSVMLGIFLLFSSLANAADTTEQASANERPEATPHQVVDNVTIELMQVVSGGKKALKDNPEKYFADVRRIMESAVDFKYIARNVMGAKYWKSASKEQREKFIEVFTSGLVETYAKGMANFADFEISLEAPNKANEGKKKVEVVQKFKGPNGVNRVSYTMGQHKSGAWKLINVVLDGVNLGKTLRSQFSQSVAETGGDLDAAISSWSWKG